MQLFDQLAELRAGRPVYPGYGGISGQWVGAGGDVVVQALAVGNPKGAVLVTQTFDLSRQRGIVRAQHEQVAEDLLYLGFLSFELAPETGASIELLAAQQYVLPFLNLHLELEVGLVDQLQFGQWAIEQLLEVINVAAEHANAGEGDEQSKQQAATDQRENLGAQGFLEHGEVSSCEKNVNEHPSRCFGCIGGVTVFFS